MKFALLSFLLVSGVAIGQNFELGKVSIEELKETSHPEDPDAEAAILFEKGTADVQFLNGIQLTFTVRRRIKIYKKDGYDMGDVTVPFYTGETVRISDAITYNLEGGQIVKTKLKKESELTEKVTKYFNRRKFTFPNVREGAILEYEYTYSTSDFISIPVWSFQEEIPVNHSEFTLLTPKELIYTPNFKGGIAPEVKREKISRFAEAYDKVVLIIKKAPAFAGESYVNNIDNYTSSVQYEMSDVNFPGYSTEKYHLTWGSLLRGIMKHEDFGDELKKKGYFEEELGPALSGISDPSAKMTAVLSFVKDKVKWNNQDGVFCDVGVKKAYKDKIGNVAEINLMLTAMLRHAGFTAAPVVLSTRDNGIAFFPRRGTFNYVVAAVSEGDKITFLDASEKFSTPGVLPFRTLNWNGYKLNEDGSYAIVDIRPEKVSRENTTLIASLSEDGRVEGQMRRMMADNLALNFRNEHENDTPDQYLEDLEKENGGIEISDYKTEGTDPSKAMSETYTFRKEAMAEKIGDRMYLSPLLFLTEEENPFKLERREFPVDFGYPVERRFILSVALPVGYAVESVPANISMVADEGIGSFKFAISNTSGKLQIVATTTVNSSVVSPAHYEILKTFFQSMVDKQKEKIILKKA